MCPLIGVIVRLSKHFVDRIYSSINTNHLLPVDDEEHTRQRVLQKALLVAMDGEFPCPVDVERVLSIVPGGRPRQIMDVGCGDGSW